MEESQNRDILDRMFSIIDDQVSKMQEHNYKVALRNFKGTPMKLEFAKNEVKRYATLGVSKSDIALLASSWGLSTKDLEELNNFLHDLDLKHVLKDQPQEGIVL